MTFLKVLGGYDAAWMSSCEFQKLFITSHVLPLKNNLPQLERALLENYGFGKITILSRSGPFGREREM